VRATSAFTENHSPEGRSIFCPQYSWQSFDPQGTEYLTPRYYEKLLKPYVFDDCSDLQIFERFLAWGSPKKRVRALEIGPGTGRATEVLLKTLDTPELILLDQSHRMLGFLGQRFGPQNVSRFVASDAIDYLASMSESYDLVFSLWGLSHSIHQTLSKFGMSFGRSKVCAALQNLFCNGLSSSGRFFLVHFDSTSEEQTIVLRQRSKEFPWFRPGEHSPSKVIIDSVLSDIRRKGLIDFKVEHLHGAPIEYVDLDEALEIFMNFHMEGYFNDTARLKNVLIEVTQDLRRFKQPDGTIRVRPGCFVYTCRK